MDTICIPMMVEEALSESIAIFPAELQATLKVKFAGYYENPETPLVELVLRKRITDNHAQRLLFTPTNEQGAYYVHLIQGPPPSAPENHPCFIVCQRYLAILYLCHARNWPFAKEFILNGGLNALVELFDHENMHFRGQALDVFTQITSNPQFEWFNAPDCSESKSLHSKMLLLTNTSEFVRSLVGNKDIVAMSYYALQILAFFMSWVRKLYTKGELRLSTGLLQTLSEWKEAPDLSDEERTLATSVFEDFNRWPPADAPSPSNNNHPNGDSPQDSSFSGIEYPQGTLNLKQAQQAILVFDYDIAISLCNEIIDLDCKSIDSIQAFGLRGRARRLRNLDRSDLKTAVDDYDSALELIEERNCHGDYIGVCDVVVEKATALAQLNMFPLAISCLTNALNITNGDLLLNEDDKIQLNTKLLEIEQLHQEFQKGYEKQHAKEKTIYKAILQRRGKEIPESNQPQQVVPEDRTTIDKTSSMPSNQATNDSTSIQTLNFGQVKAKSMAKSSKKSTPLMPPLTRRILKYKKDPKLMAELLSSVSTADFMHDVSGILNPEVLRGILDGLHHETIPVSQAQKILETLQQIPSYELTLDLADDPALTALTNLTI